MDRTSQREPEKDKGLVRHNSWAEEMEEEITRREEVEEETEDNRRKREEDREQWVSGKRTPSSWAKKLQGEMSNAG